MPAPRFAIGAAQLADSFQIRSCRCQRPPAPPRPALPPEPLRPPAPAETPPPAPACAPPAPAALLPAALEPAKPLPLDPAALMPAAPRPAIEVVIGVPSHFVVAGPSMFVQPIPTAEPSIPQLFVVVLQHGVSVTPVKPGMGSDCIGTGQLIFGAGPIQAPPVM
jgi:hypothetical protein